MHYNPFNIKPYLSKTFITDNSEWTISSSGIIGENKKYFAKYPELKDAQVKYLGGITEDKYIENYSNSMATSEFESKIIKSLIPVSKGNKIVIGFVPKNDLEKTIQIFTAPLIKII